MKNKRPFGKTFLLWTIIVMTNFLPPVESAPQTSDLDAVFKGYKAAFIIKEIGASKAFRYHPDLCAEEISPCSTFKIFNSLAALDSGALKDENETFKWDGTRHSISAWNKDHNLKTAVSDSAVWYFQKIAQKIGPERMHKYIQSMHYGNENMSSGLTKFWLGEENSLKISADEQVAFITKLYKDELPVSKRASTTVKSLIKLKETPEGTLYGKTGSDMQNGKLTLGWFVGYVKCKDKAYAFATNIRSGDKAYGRKARLLTEAVLQQMRLL